MGLECKTLDHFSLRFAHNAENLVFPGPPGVGKSHRAIAMGIVAVNAGFKVYLLKGHMSYTTIPIHIVVRNMF